MPETWGAMVGRKDHARGGLGARVSSAVRHPRRTVRRLRLRARLLSLRVRNRLSRRPVTGSADVVVSMTSHGQRISTVFAAIESIAQGTVLPARMVLWISDDDAWSNPPIELVRLQLRGLELQRSEDFGPHKKQYPYARTFETGDRRLAVADDDVFYPRDWLAGLIEAARLHPDDVHGYRAHRLAVTDDDAIGPYATWTPAPSDIGSFAIMCTGIGGIIYPASLITALQSAGERFKEVAPRADDVWVHAISVESGIRTRQIAARWRDLDPIPGSQTGTLYHQNVRRGGNDEQIAAAYSQAAIARVVADVRLLDAP